MHFSDEGKAESYLMNIGYHRLSAYIYPFYKSPKSDLRLKEGTTFEQVLTLCAFKRIVTYRCDGIAYINFYEVRAFTKRRSAN